jgi:hypothetical protein
LFETRKSAINNQVFKAGKMESINEWPLYPSRASIRWYQLTLWIFQSEIGWSMTWLSALSLVSLTLSLEPLFTCITTDHEHTDPNLKTHFKATTKKLDC